MSGGRAEGRIQKDDGSHLLETLRWDRSRARKTAWTGWIPKSEHGGSLLAIKVGCIYFTGLSGCMPNNSIP